MESKVPPFYTETDERPRVYWYLLSHTESSTSPFSSVLISINLMEERVPKFCPCLYPPYPSLPLFSASL